MKLRQWLGGLNLLVTLVLIGVLFIFINYISSRRYYRTDISATKISALSDKTRQALKQLQQPVRIVVFYQPSNRLYEMIRDVLKEYERAGSKVAVEYVDPQQDLARARQMVLEFGIDPKRDQAMIIVAAASSNLAAKPRHKFLSDTDLADYDYSSMGMGGGQPNLKAFKGEDALTSAILSVTQNTQPLIWLTHGHGEKSLEDRDEMGLSDLAKDLERENMQAKTVTLLEQKTIPSTVGAVVIVGPTARFLEQELLMLEDYLRHGGRVLAMIDPLTDTGLDGLLLHWGAELGMDIVVDPARQLPHVSPANLFVTTYSQHPIVEHMQTLMTLFPLARSVKAGAPRQGVITTVLALTSPQGWGETSVNTQPFEYNKGIDTPGPVPIAVASESTGGARLVAIGDSDFVENGQITNVGNADLVLGAFHWLVGQEQLIGIGPKPIGSMKLNLTAAQMKRIFWLTFVGLPCAFGILGTVVWWKRRT